MAQSSLPSPFVEDLPAAQSVHEGAAEAEYCPAAQLVHRAPAWEYFPPAQ
eukprot:SAG25_NODE_11928_length_292_cov_0.497409_1_plen_49_part_01